MESTTLNASTTANSTPLKPCHQLPLKQYWSQPNSKPISQHGGPTTIHSKVPPLLLRSLHSSSSFKEDLEKRRRQPVIAKNSGSILATSEDNMPVDNANNQVFTKKKKNGPQEPPKYLIIKRSNKKQLLDHLLEELQTKSESK